MPNEYLDKVNLNGTTYDIKDTISGYTTNTGTVTSIAAGTGLSGGTINTSGTISLDTTRALTTSDITTGTDTTNKLVSAKTIADALSGLGGGTVTSVGITNGGGLTVSGSPVTTSGNITVGHSNSVTAQNTQGVYPVTIDANGHIASYGSKEDIFKVFTIDTSNDYDMSDLQNLSTFGVSISSSDVAALDAVYDTKKVALQLIVSDDGDEYTIMGYSTGERFSFTYNEVLTFSNIMKFTFAGDYANSLITLALAKSEFVGCIYVIPECNVSAYANRLCLRGIPIGDALTSVINSGTINGWCPDGGGAYTFYIEDGAGDAGTLHFYNEKSPHYVLAGPSSGSSANYPTFRALVADDIPSLTVSKISDMPSIPTAGTTATAVSTTASGGSASTYSKSDHVHNISSSTITSALGYTPYNSSNPNGYTNNTGTITGVSVNNTSVATSGVANIQLKTINGDAITGTGDITVSSSDTNVTNTLATTTKYYMTGTTSASTNTGTQVFDTGIYSTTTAGQLNATTYKVNESVTLQWNSTDNSLDFIF